MLSCPPEPITHLLHRQTGRATGPNPIARLLARIRSHHKLVRRLEVRSFRIVVRRHVLRQQQHLHFAPRRREHVRHVRRIGAVAQTAALEQHRRLRSVALANFYARPCIAKAVRPIRVQVDFREAVPSTGADALDHDPDALVTLRLEAVRTRQVCSSAASEQEYVARTAERVHVTLVRRHLGADKATVAAVLRAVVGGTDAANATAVRLAILQKVDELVAQLKAERTVGNRREINE